MELLIDSRHGVYIPQLFAEMVLSGQLPVNFPTLRTYLGDLGNPEHEGYWEAWDSVLSQAKIQISGVTYYLYQDGDLFLVEEGTEIPE
jgi:hypothetical protein